MHRGLRYALMNAAVAGAAAAQEPPAPPAQRPAAIPTPARQGGTPSAPIASRPIDDVDRFRDGRTAAVTRAGSRFDLDLAPVDLRADPLLLVEGAAITRPELDRQLCLLLGSNEIDQFITGELLRRVKTEMAAAGEPVPVVSVSEEEVRRKFEEDMKILPRQRGMEPAEYERQIKEVFGWERYVEFQKLQMEFERFFLPDPPEEWAKRQQAEAARLDAEHKRLQQERAAHEPPAPPEGGEGGKPATTKKPEAPPAPPADLSFVPARTWTLLDPSFVTPVRNNYARGHAMHPLFRGGLVMSIRRKLLEGAAIRLAGPDEADAVLFVGDAPLRLRDLLALLGPRIDDATRRIALRELVNLRAADLQLRRDGVLMTDAEAAAAWDEFQRKYAGSLVPAEYAVTAFGFNSVWHYRAYFRRKRSYERLVEERLDDAGLAAHYEKAGRVFFESGTCIAQVLFVPGDDRAEAKAGIDALLAEVAAGRSFAAVAREKGRFPDGGDVHGGAIAPLIRNKLRTALGESEYASFLSGYSFADEAFYAAREDALLGPVWRDLSPRLTGWVALHVDKFFTTGVKGSISDPKMRERALDDYADVTFPRYVNEALARCRVDLPPRR